MRTRNTVYEDAYGVIEPQITADGIHVYPFDPAFPLDVRFLSFGRTHHIRMNRHAYFELLFLHSGEVIYQVQDRYFRLRRGDLFVVGSTQLHRMSEYPSGTIKTAVLYFLPELIRTGKATGEDVEYLMPFLVQDTGFPHVIPASTGIPAQVFELMKRTRAELPVISGRGRLSVRTYLKMILVLLVNYYADYRGAEGIHVRKQLEFDRLRPLFDYIDRNYSSPISVEQAALVLNMSRSNFMRFFKHVTGQSFITHLNHFRIAKAESLLATTDKPIVVVGQEVGFCDQSYFGVTFRTLLGTTPRQYREQIRRSGSEQAGRRKRSARVIPFLPEAARR